MDLRENIIVDQILNGEKYFYRGISVDNVIFGYHAKDLKVLLLKPQQSESWLLPGGYVKKEETVESAAYRIVRYRTGLKDMLLSQFKVFSDPGRNTDTFFTPEFLKDFTKSDNVEGHWLLDNFISVGFFALTEYSKVKARGDFYAEECCWWDISNLPALGFDHKHIINEALIGLKHFAYRHPIGYELLPEKFTIPELQSLYETIFAKKLDTRNFMKKLVAIGLIEKLEEKKSIGGHRSPYLYKFVKQRYDELIAGDELIII